MEQAAAVLTCKKCTNIGVVSAQAAGWPMMDQNWGCTGLNLQN